MSIELLESRIAPATVTVTNLHDSGPGSLRAALTAVQSDTSGGNNIINFASSLHGTILLKSSLPNIRENLDLAGPGAGKLTIDGHDANQIFDIYFNSGATAAPPTVTISGLTLSHGLNQQTAESNSNGPAGGGAILINDPGGTVTLSSTVLTKNESIGAASTGTSNGYLGKGGAIDLESGSLTVRLSTVTGNIARGGVAPSGYTGGMAMGGAIYVGQYGSLSLTSSIVSGNKAIGGAGLAGANGAAGAKVGPGQAGNNGTDGLNGGYGGEAYGGAVFSIGAVIVKNSTVSGNSAAGGAGGNGGHGGNGGSGGRAFTSGGIHNAAGTGGNGGDGGNGGTPGNAIGGGIVSGLVADNGLSTTASLTMLNSTISGNTASAGAIGKLGKAGNAGSGAPRGSAGNAGFAGTAGTSTAGGIYSYGGALNLTQVTIAKNTAGQGGGIYLTADPTVAIDNCTSAFNTALIQGGGLYAIPDLANDPIHVISTIIGQNSAPTSADVAGYLTADNSLIQITGSATIVDNSSTDITGESPLLGALGNHGGTTQTLLPGKHSPAIGTGFSVAGVTPTMDQRGDPRTINGEVDIGSVEVG